MHNYYEKQFELRYFEMNKFGEASPTAILTLLEETAADHCYSINHSLYDLENQNVGWVLLSGVIEMDRYPLYKVRHEAVRITVKRSLIIKNDLTSCSIMSNLPAHASMVTLGCEAAGTKLPENYQHFQERWFGWYGEIK
jgi:hypothetical protein